MWWDTHFHLDSFDKKGMIPELLQSAAEADVTRMTAIGGSDEANALALNTAKSFPDQLVCSVGYDRDMATGWDQNTSNLESLIHQPKVVAIGECGLDYFHTTENIPEQHTLFEANLELALQCKKPVVVHSREAEDDTLAVLQNYSNAWKEPDRPCAILHCFTGDTAFAKKLIDLNIMISFSGILTFKNATQIQEAATALPDEVLLVETDSPYLAPVPYRGERNQPAYVAEVGKKLAEIRNQSAETIASLTTQNAARTFQTGQCRSAAPAEKS